MNQEELPKPVCYTSSYTIAHLISTLVMYIACQ